MMNNAIKLLCLRDNKKWVTSCILIIGTVFPPTTAAQVSYLQMGVNVNERPHWLESRLLKQSQTTWVRAFIEASHYIKGERQLDNDFRIKALKRVAGSGHKVLLSIKWNLKEAGWHVPKPGSHREQQWFKFASDLLQALDGDLSILVLVNEITIDTPSKDLQRDGDGTIPFVKFQKRLLNYISNLSPQAADGTSLPIYTGGFTRLDLKKQQNLPANRAMFKWINEEPRLSGADFHMHQPDYESSIEAADFIREQIPQKPLIVTEFSLVWKWKEYLGDKIGNSETGILFLKNYNLDPNLTVAQYCTKVFANPVPESEWQEFLKSQGWFEPDYLDVMGRMMENRGVVVATYAFTSNPEKGGARRITPKSTPWFIHQLLLPHIAEGGNSNRVAENYGLFKSFVRWQKVTAELTTPHQD